MRNVGVRLEYTFSVNQHVPYKTQGENVTRGPEVGDESSTATGLQPRAYVLEIKTLFLFKVYRFTFKIASDPSVGCLHLWAQGGRQRGGGGGSFQPCSIRGEHLGGLAYRVVTGEAPHGHPSLLSPQP